MATAASATGVASQEIKIRGRQIAYDVVGDARGDPVFYFHGSPASRLEARFLAEAAAANGLRIIAPDRPGMGLSDGQPGRSILDWPPVIEALSRDLGIDRFSVMSFSTGSLYLYACAFALSERITSASVVSGTGPPDLMRGISGGWLTLVAAASMPRLGRLLFGSVARRLRQHPDTFTLPGLAEVDKKALEAPLNREIFVESLSEAFRNGPDGVVEDQVLITRPWGFDPSAISVPLRLWHGTADHTVPVRVAYEMARRLQGVRVHAIAGEGHISLLSNCGHEILSQHRMGTAGSN